MNVKPLFLAATALAGLFIHSLAIADFDGKPMSDKEIRELIIKGALSDFDKGQCFQKTVVPIEQPTQPPPDSGSTSNSVTRSYNSGTFRPTYSLSVTDQTQERTPAPEPEPIFRCQCACPYSLNIKNQQCGEGSAYFQYPNQYKPKCYIEDIKDWEVNDFRSLHEIPYK